MTKEFSIGLEYAENGVIVRQKYEDGVQLVESVGNNYKELIEKLGYILWSELEDVYSNNIGITVKIEKV